MMKLTIAAANHISSYMNKARGDIIGINISMTTNGCSGWMYKMEAAYTVPGKDEGLAFISRNIMIFVPIKDHEYLKGTEIDYVKEGLNEGFKFDNPNVEASCGCGESFSLKLNTAAIEYGDIKGVPV